MKKGLLFVCLIIICLFFTGCKNEMAGDYELIQLMNGEDVLTQYDLRSYGISFELKVNGDNTAVLKEGDETTSLTYNDGKFVSSEGDKREFKYTFDGTELILDETGDKMFFQKKK